MYSKSMYDRRIDDVMIHDAADLQLVVVFVDLWNFDLDTYSKFVSNYSHYKKT